MRYTKTCILGMTTKIFKDQQKILTITYRMVSFDLFYFKYPRYRYSLGAMRQCKTSPCMVERFKKRYIQIHKVQVCWDWESMYFTHVIQIAADLTNFSSINYLSDEGQEMYSTIREKKFLTICGSSVASAQEPNISHSILVFSKYGTRMGIIHTENIMQRNYHVIQTMKTWLFIQCRHG